METVNILIKDIRFWLALMLLIKSVLFLVAPNFPEQAWVAIDTFVAAVLAILSGNNVVQVKQTRALRAAQMKEEANG